MRNRSTILKKDFSVVGPEELNSTPVVSLTASFSNSIEPVCSTRKNERLYFQMI